MAVIPALFGLLMAALVSGQHVEIKPTSAVRTVGSELEVVCKVPFSIDSCRILVGTSSYRLKPGEDNGDVTYFGEGLQNGECGAKFRNIQESWNGNISCVLPPQSGAIEITGTMRLIVAKPPQDPRLTTDRDQQGLSPVYKEGEQFSGECVVAGGRPAARIQWLLDDEVLLEGLHQANLTSNGDLETISQRITRRLSADDGARTLVCRAEHPALPQPREAKWQLIVQYPPKVESNTITIFGLQLNAEGRLNVTVRANPPPTAEWVVGAERIRAPGRSNDALLLAQEPLHLGGGYYNVTLVIDQVTKDDVDRTYYLHLTNAQGHEEISVRISTMEEPAGVELDTGAIVGIVIAVLVLLIAISLVVFAFATDRWCFAGRSHRTDIPDGADSEAPLPSHDDVKGSENPSHDHGEYIINGDRRRRDNPKSSGESDTESAVGGKERSRLAQIGARVRAALPKAKDKVQATEATPQDETDKPEDKVVYASLALTEQTPAEKPPPAFAEYAEIMYTEGGQKEAKDN